MALGITWVLDGLEVTLAGSVAGVLKDKASLGLTEHEVGLTAAAYLSGAVLGALLFGYLTDRLGRKKLFTVTLLLYLAATAATAFSWNLESYLVFRFFTGAGIGGEYSAINSAIDELIPARVRGRVDLIINSTFWLGAALGAAASILLLDPARFAVDRGWRYAFGIGAVLGLAILFLRHWVPESPRWLMTHGRNDEAETIVGDIEREVSDHPDMLEPVTQKARIRVRASTPWSEIWHAIAVENRSRSLLGLTLMVAQAFFYNAIFFTYALVLGTFYGVTPGQTGLYLFPFAIGNFLGPLVIGRLFDTIGRKPMIAITYGVSGILLVRQRLDVPGGNAHGHDPGHGLDRDLLHRLLGRERRLPDGERDLPARDPRHRDRDLLCGRHAGGRRRRAGAVRGADRRGIARALVLGLCRRRRPDGGGGRRRSADRRQGGRAVARIHHDTALGPCGLSPGPRAQQMGGPAYHRVSFRA